MKAKTKLIILISVLSVAIVATATGVTVAYWMGAEGSNVVAPQTDSTDWNPWAKYIIYAEISTGGYEAIGCNGILENVIIPEYATGGWLLGDDGTLTRITATGNSSKVFRVRNTLFADTSDKAIPVTLTIPTTVEIDPHTFAGLTSLTKITIKTAKKLDGTNSHAMSIGQLAFLGCSNVKEFVIDDRRTELFVTGVNLEGFDDFKTATGLFVDDLTLTYA